MAFEAGAATAKLVLDVSGFRAGFMQAESLSRLFPGVVTNFLASPLLGLIGIAQRAGRALVGMVAGVTNQQDDLRDTAQTFGVSVEFLSGWGQAAELAGSNAQELGESLRFISNSAATAAAEIGKGEPGAAASAYEKLGVSVLDAAGQMKPLEQLTREVQAGFAAMPAGANRTAIALDILGRSGAGMLAFFGQAPEEINAYVRRLEQMGAITTTEAANQADAWNDLMVEAGHAWGGIKQQLAEPLRDALIPYLTGVLDWVRTHPGEIRETIASVVAGVESGFTAVAAAGLVLKPVVEGIIENLGPIGFVGASLLAVKTIAGLVGSLQTLAKTAAVTQALSGPAGWAALAVGLVAAAAAGAQVDLAFEGATEKVRAFQEAARGAATASNGLAAAAPAGAGSLLDDLSAGAFPAAAGPGAAGGRVRGGVDPAGERGAGAVTIDGISVSIAVDPKATAEEVSQQLIGPVRDGLARARQEAEGLAFAGRVYDAMA